MSAVKIPASEKQPKSAARGPRTKKETSYSAYIVLFYPRPSPNLRSASSQLKGI
jgi:hypothetical protein